MMKTIRLFAGLVLLAGSFANPLAPMAAAQDTGPKGQELQEFCYDLMASGDFDTMNLGECMSFNETLGRAGFVAHVCDGLLELGFLDDLGFESYSDCVREYP